MDTKLIMEILSYNVTPQFPDWPVTKQTVINTINPHSYCVAKKDIDFQRALHRSDFLLPDGIGIVIAARILNRERIKKIAGYDLFLNLMLQINEQQGKCFFLGAAPKTLEKIQLRIAQEYPSVKVQSYSPPYKSVFSEEDSKEMCKKINEFSPDVLFVGMTAPKQEKWVDQNKDNLHVNMISSIGAVFDFYAGTVKRPSEFWIKSGLEWLPRFLKEPKRLAERNLVSTPKFLFEIVKAKIKIN